MPIIITHSEDLNLRNATIERKRRINNSILTYLLPLVAYTNM